MNKKKVALAQFIAFVSGGIAFVFLVKQLLNFQKIELNLSVGAILVILLLFLLIHSLKFIRYYFILSETPISIMTLIPIYLETTLLNILLPFKVGEIYRFYIVGETIDNYWVSFLSILTERFFDTSVVAIILTAQIFLFQGNPDGIYLFFLIFVGTLFLVYKMYPQTYYYLNMYFLRKKDKPRDILALQFLQETNYIYHDEKAIVKDRGILIFLLSFFSWIAEFFLLNSLAKILGIHFNFLEFSTYIKSILSLTSISTNLLSIVYIILSTVLLSIVLIIFKSIFRK